MDIARLSPCVVPSSDNLKLWWELLISEGEKYGYFVNASKSWLIAKNSDLLNHARVVFQNSDIKFTKEGKRHLGAAIGREEFRASYAKEKVNSWCEELIGVSMLKRNLMHMQLSVRENSTNTPIFSERSQLWKNSWNH